MPQLPDSFYHYIGDPSSPIYNSPMLRGKNTGCSVRLLGQVTLITVLVDDAESQWTEQAKTLLLSCMRTGAEFLLKSSQLPPEQLRLFTTQRSVRLPYVASRSNWSRFVKDVMHQLGAQSTEEYQRDYEQAHARTDCCVSLVFNKKFRGYAVKTVAPDQPYQEPHPYGEEISVVGFYPDNLAYSQKILVHEILHQFGAVDLYFPEEVKSAADRYLPNSIMSTGQQIDPLTRYLIGWDKILSAKARAFLKATAHLTEEDFDKAIDAEWAKTKK